MTTSLDGWIGSELAGYRLEAVVGRGGMGVVYRAWDPRLKRRVALKVVAPELSGDQRFRERFLRETELAASLDHPNVIPVYEAGEREGRLFLAMRYVEGSDLETLLGQGPLDPGRALAICDQLAGALDAAHERGLVHRDVKPSNVLLDGNEHVYLADFGLSRELAEAAPLAADGRSVGTPAYAAPEQIRGDHAGAAADRYALGCVLYRCLTAETPFPRDRDLAVLFAHLEDEPPRASARNPQLSPQIDPVLAKALAKQPAERYATSRQLIAAARDALGIRDVEVVRDRRPLLLTALGVVVAAAAIVAALALRGAGEPKPDLTVSANSLVRIDPRSNKITAVTKVGQGPESVAAAGSTVWVYNWDDRTVSGVDTATNTVIRTRSIAGSPPFITGSSSVAADANGAWALSNEAGRGLLTHVRAGDELPQELAFPYDPVSIAMADGVAWVGAKSVNGNVVLRIDPRTGSVDRVIPLRNATIDPQTSYRDIRWVAVGEGSVWALLGGTVFRIDPATARVTGRVDLPGNEAVQIGVGHGLVWALTFVASEGKQLVGIDPRTLQVTKTIGAPDVPGAGSSNFTGSFAIGTDAIWWSGGETGTVWHVDPRSGAIASTIRLTPPAMGYADVQPYATASSGDAVWVTVRVPP